MAASGWSPRSERCGGRPTKPTRSSASPTFKSLPSWPCAAPTFPWDGYRPTASSSFPPGGDLTYCSRCRRSLGPGGASAHCSWDDWRVEGRANSGLAQVELERAAEVAAAVPAARLPLDRHLPGDLGGGLLDVAREPGQAGLPAGVGRLDAGVGERR